MPDEPEPEPDQPEPKRGRGRPPKLGGRAVNRISAPSGPRWGEWLAALAEHAGLSKADLIEQALADFARKAKFRRPPPRSE